MDPHMQGSDPHMEGSGPSNPYGFEGPRPVWSVERLGCFDAFWRVMPILLTPEKLSDPLVFKC